MRALRFGFVRAGLDSPRLFCASALMGDAWWADMRASWQMRDDVEAITLAKERELGRRIPRVPRIGF